MSTVYVHIGMPKTGTTYLQNFLERNEALLSREGYTFPIFETTFEKIAKGRNAYFLRYKVYDEYEEIYRNHMNILEELGKKYDHIILSNESHWNDKFLSWEDIQKDFASIGLTLKLVIYLRRQDAFAQSLWAQKIKTGYTRSFPTFLESPLFNDYYLDYYKRLQELSSEIGRENIIVRTYDKARFARLGTSITADFLEAVGLTETDEYVQLETANLNPSLFGPYLEVKRLLNRNPIFKTRQNFGTKLLINIMQGEGHYIDFNSNQFLSRADQKKLLKKFKQSNALVAREYLHKEDGILFEEQPAKQRYRKAPTYEARDLVQICSKMIVQQQSTIEELQKKLEDTNL